MVCTFTCMGLGQADLFDEKWEEAKGYLADNQMEVLLVTIKELEELATKKQPIQQGKIAYLLGEYWYDKEDQLKAINYLNIAINNLQEDTIEQLILAESYLVRGYCFFDEDEIDKTHADYEKNLKLKQKIFGEHHEKVSSAYFNLGYILQEKRNLVKSDAAFQKGLDILKTLYPEENEQFADFYDELGYNQSAKGDFNSAIKYLQKSIAIKSKILGNEDEKLAYPYKYLGLLYKDYEYFEKAIDYFQKALQIVENQPIRDVYQEGMLHFHIGNAYLELKKYNQSYSYFDRAIDIDKTNNFLLPEIHRLGGEIESQKGNARAADIHFKIAEDGFQNNMKNNREYLYGTYESIMKHQFFSGNYEKALSISEKALFVGKNHANEFFNLYRNRGLCYYFLGDFKKAIASFEKAKEENDGTLVWEESNLRQLKNAVLLNLAYADFYLGQKEKLGYLATLQKTDSLFTKTIDFIDFVTKKYQERSIKENFIEQFYQTYRKAIDVKYLLFEETEERKYLENAFFLAEKSKNLILIQTLNNIRAFELSDIPASILEKENKLKTNITYLENRRFEEKQKPKINTTIIKELNDEIFDLKRQYENLLVQIKQDYPKYYELKFSSTIVSVPSVQQNILTNEQTIVEYFIGDAAIYVFLIKKDDFQVFTLRKDKDLATKINDFRESIYSYRLPKNGKAGQLNNSYIKVTNDLGFELYKKLVQPFHHELTRKITIIADGALGYLPFDALITELPAPNKKFSTPTYLMNEHLISNAHSVNWLNGLFEEKDIDFEQNFVGIAPMFKGTIDGNLVADFRMSLGPLNHNQEEVKNIKNNIGGKVITGAAATRKSFLEYIQKGQVLHLATHGKSNDKQGDYSYLAFAEPKDTSDNQFLYVRDLFNLKIPADLVVLSACETGLGELKRGEGIVSIGKGFSYAGAKSMVTTLWRVSDNSTANFMPIFYKNLKTGLPKDEALWNAKKEFIQTYRNAAHPFFWSGYVAYGNMQPIDFQHSNLSIPLIVAVFLIGIGFSFFLYRRFSTKNMAV